MSTPSPSLGLPGVLSLANSKGGCGKTSLAANLAGLTAAAGIKTLAIDWDPQGNLSRDLGLPRVDGLQLRRALEDGAPLPVALDPQRPHLGVVQSGPRLEEIIALQIARGADGPSLAEQVHASLGAIVDDWELVIIDTSPGNRPLVEAAFGVSRGVVIPSRADEASYDGVEQTAARFQSVHDSVNPDVQLLGVVLFDIGSQATKVEANARQTLESMLEGLRFTPAVFPARIRHSQSAAVDTRASGRLVHELEGDVAKAHAERFQAIREGKALPYHSSSLDGLAGDYASLAEQILERLQTLQGVK